MERYVKCIKKWFNEDSELGKIYDTSKPFPTHLDWCKDETWKNVLVDNRYHKNTLGWKTWFIPSTEKEYMIQEQGFYVEDPLVEDLSYIEPLLKLLEEIKN